MIESAPDRCVSFLATTAGLILVFVRFFLRMDPDEPEPDITGPAPDGRDHGGGFVFSDLAVHHPERSAIKLPAVVF